MWNNLLDNAKRVAEKAKTAAEQLEGQLNESVGAKPAVSSFTTFTKDPAATPGVALETVGPNSFDDDDAFYNDEEDEMDHDKGNKLKPTKDVDFNDEGERAEKKEVVDLNQVQHNNNDSSDGLTAKEVNVDFQAAQPSTVSQTDDNAFTDGDGWDQDEIDNISLNEVAINENTDEKKGDNIVEENSDMKETDDPTNHENYIRKEEHIEERGIGTEINENSLNECDSVEKQNNTKSALLNGNIFSTMTGMILKAEETGVEENDGEIQNSEGLLHVKDSGIPKERNATFEESSENGRQGSVNLIGKKGDVEQIVEIANESKQTPEDFVENINQSTSPEAEGKEIDIDSETVKKHALVNLPRDDIGASEDSEDMDVEKVARDNITLIRHEEVTVNTTDTTVISKMETKKVEENLNYQAKISTKHQGENSIADVADTENDDKQILEPVTDISSNLDLNQHATLNGSSSTNNGFHTQDSSIAHENKTDKEYPAIGEDDGATINALQLQISDLKEQIIQRESQLTSKSVQMTSMMEAFEAEKLEMKAKVRETKDEAKKRVLKARDRIEEIQALLADATAQAEAAEASKTNLEEIIEALRSEGESLARKQSEMEKRVREARSEMRDIENDLNVQTQGKTKAEAKVIELEAQLKTTKEELASAKRGQTRADKLDSDLLTAREKSEEKEARIKSLEGEVKELKKSKTKMKNDMENAMKEKLTTNEMESSKLRKEKDDLLKDLELKLRTSEREANLREDALRHEVGEVRKRWQDAVRRIDALSMDLQHSSAPLMRQLESTERQHRVRAAAWTELETKLRSDLEEYVIQNERLTKEQSQLTTKATRLERLIKNKEEDLCSSEAQIEKLQDRVEELEASLENVNDELQIMKETNSKLKKSMKENDAKVRNDMMKSARESEERFQNQISSLELELLEERNRNKSTQSNVEQLATTAGTTTSRSYVRNGEKYQERSQQLGAKDNQAQILQSTILGLDDNDNDLNSFSDSESVHHSDEIDMVASSGAGSFAYMEQLSQGLKAAKTELGALRKQLHESEEERKSLESELVKSRDAYEKYPTLETKVSEMMTDIAEKEMEILGLRDDMTEMRLLYRSQLDTLIEEKATNIPQNVAPNEDTQIEHLSSGFGI